MDEQEAAEKSFPRKDLSDFAFRFNENNIEMLSFNALVHLYISNNIIAYIF